MVLKTDCCVHVLNPTWMECTYEWNCAAPPPRLIGAPTTSPEAMRFVPIEDRCVIGEGVAARFFSCILHGFTKGQARCWRSRHFSIIVRTFPRKTSQQNKLPAAFLIDMQREVSDGFDCQLNHPIGYLPPWKHFIIGSFARPEGRTEPEEQWLKTFLRTCTEATF